MPTKDPRYSLRISPDMKKRIEKYWHEHELKNMNTAINQLIDIAFKAIDEGRVTYVVEQAKPVNDISDDALDVAKMYDRLDIFYQPGVKSMMKTMSRQQREMDDAIKKDLA